MNTSGTQQGSTDKPPSKGRKGLYILTHGCQMNEYDSQKLFKILEQDFYPVGTAEEADLVLINTCSVRDKPEQKLYSYLGRMRELKRSRPGLMVGVGGCVAQQEGERIVKRSRDVDFVFGTHNLSLVPSLVQLRSSGSAPQVAVDYRDEWEELPLGFAQFDSSKNAKKQHVTAFISISRGCNKNCTYCIVPTTRGPEVSRAQEEILREVRLAVHRGSREIVLLGQTVNSYGRDLNPRRSFTELLRLIAEIEGVQRIRFTSPHPQDMRSDLIDLFAAEPKLCRHVHMPLQSGSDRILKAMNRNYRMRRFHEIVYEFRSKVPDLSVTTDLIVGFPGEERVDFEQTLSAMRELRFDSSFSFAFSPRPGTVAAELEDNIPKREKLDRLRELQALQYELTAASLASWVDREVELLVDAEDNFREDALRGRSSQNWVVSLSGLAADSYVKVGDTVRAHITGVNTFTLQGELPS